MFVFGATELLLLVEKAGDVPYVVIELVSIIVDKTMLLGKAFWKSEAAGKALLNVMMGC